MLIDAFTHYFNEGEAFSTIVEARAYAESILGKKVNSGTFLAKQVEESLEAALVRAARTIVNNSSSPQQAYVRLVDLYQRQPRLGTRSSTSVLQQAYSTPIPIAYLAAVLAQITPHKTIYEPTAGHGALLIASNPANTTVNELNRDRASDLRSQGYTVTEQDASIYLPDSQHDVVIMNPPFGSVANRRFNTGRYSTTQIDHAIALHALKAMKSDGRTVLILGGKLGSDEEQRSNRYNTKETRAFYYSLYEQYNVIEHISIWGNLYHKQGAGFPIDLIAIAGQGKSQRPLPAAEVPPIYRSFDELAKIEGSCNEGQPILLYYSTSPFPGLIDKKYKL
nr:class I SAM-dependent methyltransferase [Hydrococcus sp. Prado102]